MLAPTMVTVGSKQVSDLDKPILFALCRERKENKIKFLYVFM